MPVTKLAGRRYPLFRLRAIKPANANQFDVDLIVFTPTDNKASVIETLSAIAESMDSRDTHVFMDGNGNEYKVVGERVSKWTFEEPVSAPPPCDGEPRRELGTPAYDRAEP